MSFDVDAIRSRFPALQKQVNGQAAVFLDGPAGTQVPRVVIDAISHYLINCNANHHGVFQTSIESDAILERAHLAAANLVGSDDAGEIAFGANMTSLTFALSRALARTWEPGDEIVLSRLEHDANFSPWVLAAKDAGAEVRYVDIDPQTCTLRVEQYQELINERTRLVAVGCASNAVGTVNPVQQICSWAAEVGALSFLDAVHYAPHDLMDVQQWGCDFLVCSAYKFFGPHVGILFGRRGVLESIQPYKLRPAPGDLPGRWMTGTQNHECIAGALAAIDYLTEIGSVGAKVSDLGDNRRGHLEAAFVAIREYETGLIQHLLAGLNQVSGIKIWGKSDPQDTSDRLPTVSITHERVPPKEMAVALAHQGIFAWHGNYYALPLTEQLGVEPGGMLRLGLVHYNTIQEIDRVTETLSEITR